MMSKRHKTSLLAGAAVLALLAMGTVFTVRQQAVEAPRAAAMPTQTPLVQPPRPMPLRLADFGAEIPSDDARQVANWSLATGDHKKMSIVIVDKAQARVYVFRPDGSLSGAAPALLGLARGDHTVPGIGDRPLSQVKPEERTTPAGRFIAEMGVNTGGEDVVWVDYEAAVSMHRVRATVAKERRLERLASATADDNRISYGCINLPVSFYEGVLSPAVRQGGAVIYVLPETRTVHEVFGSVDGPRTVAAAASPGR